MRTGNILFGRGRKEEIMDAKTLTREQVLCDILVERINQIFILERDKAQLTAERDHFRSQVSGLQKDNEDLRKTLGTPIVGAGQD